MRSKTDIQEKFAHPVFKNCFLTNDLSDRDLTYLHNYVSIEDMDADSSTIFHSGKNQCLTVLLEGKLEVVEEILETNEKMTSTLSPGSSLGCINLLQPNFSDIRITAVEQSKILILTKLNFEILINNDKSSGSQIYLNICKPICDRLTVLNEEYTSLYYDNIAGESQE